MLIPSLLSGRIFRDPLRWAGITRCRFDIHPKTAGLVASIARNGHVHHVDVPVGVTLTGEQVYELVGQLLGDSPAPEPRAITPPAGQLPDTAFTPRCVSGTIVSTSPP